MTRLLMSVAGMIILSMTEKSNLEKCFYSVAERYRIAEVTVRREFEKASKEFLKNAQYQSVKHLGIDEAHLSKIPRLVLVNTGASPSKIIDICPIGRCKEPTAEALNRFIEPENIKTVTIDMCTAYRTAIQEVLPHARIIVDRFHVMQYVISAADTARSALYDIKTAEFNAMADGPAKEALKEKRGLMKMSTYHFKTNFENLSRQRKQQLKLICETYPEFSTLLKLKEDFRSFYENSENVEAAEKAYQKWVISIPTDTIYDGFRAVVKTIERWHPWIFNYFIDPKGHRFSNGPVEKQNEIIKEANRLGKGYDFETLRAKILYGNTAALKQPSLAKKRTATPFSSFCDVFPSHTTFTECENTSRAPYIEFIYRLFRLGYYDRQKLVDIDAVTLTQIMKHTLQVADYTFFTSQDSHNANICGSMRGIAQSLDALFPDAIHCMNETLSFDTPILCGLSSDEILEHLRFYSSTLKPDHM